MATENTDMSEEELYGPDRLIVFPTDTLYGLGGNGFSEKVVNKIYRIKRRSREKPLALHLFDKAEIKKYTAELTERQERLIDELLPGPYTLILPAGPDAPSCSVSGERKVGIRVPDSETFKGLSDKFNYPLVGTSVNKSGQPPITDFEEIVDRYGGLVDLFIESKDNIKNEPSTVLDLSYDPPKVLRGEYPRNQNKTD